MAIALDRPRFAMSGWILFAVTLTAVAGIFNLIYGMVVLANSEWVAVTDGATFVINLTAGGWISVGFGAVQLLAAARMMSGQRWARFLGVLWANMVVIGQIVYLSVYPLWSIVIIALSVPVIYGLTVHGDEVARDNHADFWDVASLVDHLDSLNDVVEVGVVDNVVSS